jgi:hypothetical protein
MAFIEHGEDRGLPDRYCWICAGVGDPYDPEGCYACGAVVFTDDLRGLSRAEQIARVQAVAREHGDELTDLEAGRALSLYQTLTPDHHSPGPAARCLRAALAPLDPHGRYMFTSLLPRQAAARYERLARGRHPEAGS